VSAKEGPLGWRDICGMAVGKAGWGLHTEDTVTPDSLGTAGCVGFWGPGTRFKNQLGSSVPMWSYGETSRVCELKVN
jgi:hypothetical protein